MRSSPQHVPLRGGRVDLHAARVTRGGVEHRLSDTELRLLRYLVQAEGRVVGREELLVEVWGASPKARTRAMDSAVSRLRAKLEVDPKEPQHLISVYGEGYRFVPLLEPPTRLDGLPPEPDAFVGRRAELAALDALLAEARLVTIVGVGGGGKTRLALRFAREWAAAGAGRVVLAELDRALDEEAVRVGVGRALGLPSGQLGDPEALVSALQAAPGLLLLMDNLEQVLAPAASLVRAWMDAVPGFRVLATSRSPLRLRRERVLPLEPLPEEDAAQLLVERARALRPDFAEGAAEATRALARALDGLPLAIELAAGKARTFTVHGLLKNLDARFRMLADPRGRRGARHVTLWHTLSWSWGLLDEATQVALMQASVFRGGFTAEAFAALLTLPAHLPEAWAPDLLDDLVEASLVKPQGLDGRFRTLVSVAEFAAERLADPAALPGASGPEAQAQAWRRHAAWFAQRAVTLAPKRERDPEDMDRLDADRDNVYVALERALDWRDGAVAGPLAVGLGRLIRERGPCGEAELRLAPVLELETLAPPTRQLVCLQLAVMAFYQGDLDRLEARSLRCRAMALEQGDQEGLCNAAMMLGVLARSRGQIEAALRHAEEALAGARALGRPDLELPLLGNCALALMDLGRVEESERVQREALALREEGQLDGIGLALHNLGVVVTLQGRVEEAMRLHRESIAVHLTQRDDRGVAFSLLGLLDHLIDAGLVEEARPKLAQVTAMVDAVGARHLHQYLLRAQASLDWLEGREAQAEATLREALFGGGPGGSVEDQRMPLVLLVDLLIEAGRWQEAEAALQAARLPASGAGFHLTLEVESLSAALAAWRGEAEAWARLRTLGERLGAHDNQYRGRFLARLAHLHVALGQETQARATLRTLDEVIQRLKAEGTLRQRWRRAGGRA